MIPEKLSQCFQDDKLENFDFSTLKTLYEVTFQGKNFILLPMPLSYVTEMLVLYPEDVSPFDCEL